jgi:hypothetical protein
VVRLHPGLRKQLQRQRQQQQQHETVKQAAAMCGDGVRRGKLKTAAQVMLVT